jgi:hypothetical protein
MIALQIDSSVGYVSCGRTYPLEFTEVPYAITFSSHPFQILESTFVTVLFKWLTCCHPIMTFSPFSWSHKVGGVICTLRTMKCVCLYGHTSRTLLWVLCRVPFHHFQTIENMELLTSLYLWPFQPLWCLLLSLPKHIQRATKANRIC